jgi:hypothetical protein
MELGSGNPPTISSGKPFARPRAIGLLAREPVDEVVKKERICGAEFVY